MLICRSALVHTPSTPRRMGTGRWVPMCALTPVLRDQANSVSRKGSPSHRYLNKPRKQHFCTCYSLLEPWAWSPSAQAPPQKTCLVLSAGGGCTTSATLEPAQPAHATQSCTCNDLVRLSARRPQVVAVQPQRRFKLHTPHVQPNPVPGPSQRPALPVGASSTGGGCTASARAIR
eukprot:366065-Chlamydomonas_euryale.AAC.4